MNTKLISLTPDAEKIIGYCARVSNPKNQDNPDVAGLLRFCSFQEFSQRYAEAQGFENVEPRRQDKKNRQNSLDDLHKHDKEWFNNALSEINRRSYSRYQEALSRGIAKESARFLLPLNTKTRMYMNGTVRSWIHYIGLRTHESTQKEHRDIANEIKGIFTQHLPIIADALGWSECL